MDNHMDLELIDLYDCCYLRQAVVDNAVNRRSRELLQVIKKLRGEFDAMRRRERAREEGKIYAVYTEVKEHKLNLDRMMLESQKWAGYQQSLSTLDSKDRREVVSKVIPYATMELVHSDDMGSLVGKLVSSAIVYGICRAFEQVADMKEPFDLLKVKGYRSSYKKDHTQASNDLAIATFPWLDEFVADPSAPIEALLSKKPLTLQRPAPSRT
ncbi:hypothetical protein Tco_0626329 [Tanacetum coccineum]|uniref:Uncharacterized protein n=1 Tax=Tanacetum coccineum TaxID=301880 RepID=A0ABQ4WJ92_9ASTR